MRITTAILTGVALAAQSISAQDEPAETPAEPTPAAESDIDDLTARVSQAYGTKMALGLKADGMVIDVEELVEAYKSTEAGETVITDDEMNEVRVELGQNGPPENPSDEWTSSLSRAYGTNLARGLGAQGVPMDIDRFQVAYVAALAEKPVLTEDEIQATFVDLDGYMEEKFQAEQASFRAEQASFLEEKAKEEGVEATESGLLYEVLTDAEGEKPAATDNVQVHYTGTFINGEVFDSSVESGQPASFALNRVISGWTEGLQLMAPGAKYRFFIPYDLAYGEGGRPGSIPGYATLVFDVELLAILP